MQPVWRPAVPTGEVYTAGAAGVELPASHVIVSDWTGSGGSPSRSTGHFCWIGLSRPVLLQFSISK